MKYRWYTDCELYDSEDFCGFGIDTTVEVRVTVNAEMTPADPEVGIMQEDWDLKYDFEPTQIIPTDEDGNEKEHIEYKSLSEEQKQKVVQFCNQNKDRIEEKGFDDGPSIYDDIEYYRV